MISIIVPCYNSEQYISETIDSIKNQTYDKWECIIVNDGSTDNSLDIIQTKTHNDDRFCVVNIAHSGVASARNLALSMSKSKYILPIDSDDILMPDYVNNGVNFLENHQDCSLYYASVQYFGISNFIEKPRWKTYPMMLKYDCLCVSGIYRREHALNVGGYNETLEAMEDYDFWIRYLYHNDNIHISNEIGFKYRFHADSRHNSVSDKRKKEIRSEIILLNKKIYDEYRKELGDRYCNTHNI